MREDAAEIAVMPRSASGVIGADAFERVRGARPCGTAAACGAAAFIESLGLRRRGRGGGVTGLVEAVGTAEDWA